MSRILVAALAIALTAASVLSLAPAAKAHMMTCSNMRACGFSGY